MKKILCIAISFITISSAHATTWEYNNWNNEGKTREVNQSITLLQGTQREEHIFLPVLQVPLSNVLNNFNDYRGGRNHIGVDIVAPKGTPIVSPTDAVIANMGNGPTSGLFIATVNPGGETFVYMHLHEFAKNIYPAKLVRQGDVIGFVGNTGNAQGTKDHLHFEILKNGPTDPYPRITKVFSPEAQSQYLQAYLDSQNVAQNTATSTPIAQPQASSIMVSTTTATTTTTVVPTPPNNTNTQAPTTTPNKSAPFVFKTNFGTGASGAEVRKLQELLIEQNVGKNAQALKNHGVTGFFGRLTREALREFQIKNNLTPSTGYFGPKSLRTVNATLSI